MKKHQTTIKDIAKKIGISASTVSRALNNNPNISKKTRAEVIRVAAELKYEPNQVAMSLRNQQTKTIGVIIPEIIHYFFASVIAGIEEVAYANGYTVMFCQSRESYTKEVKDTLALLSHRVDGLLISQAKETMIYDHYKEIQSRNVPLVFFDRAPSNIIENKVVINDKMAAEEATSHLCKKGCRKIVHLASGMNLDISKDRVFGYKRALEKNGMLYSPAQVIKCRTGTQEDGYKQMKKALARGLELDGVFASNDILAIGAMKAIKESGRSIPDDVSVVGFSNWNFCTMVEPTLSSVHQPAEEMGKKATELLIQCIEGDSNDNPKQTKVLETEIIERQSSMRFQDAKAF